MSESEFELYLSLLTRFLRLKPGQRSEIADELRDHLEARLEELTKTGMSREQAVHAALAEFGDAAELAQHFSLIAQQRKRRFMMRCTFGTVAGLTAAILLTTAFWPGENAGPMRQPAVAQAPPEARPPATAESLSETATAVGAEASKLVEAKLAKPYDDFGVKGVPLAQALEKIGEELQIDIFVNDQDLEQAGIAPEDEVSFGVKYTKMSAGTQLRLILQKLQLGYRIEDGIVFVESASSIQDHVEVRIFNCRDLLTRFRRLPVTAGADASGDSKKVAKEFQTDPDQVAARELIRVLCMNSNGAWGFSGGNRGTITEYNGLLLACNTPDALRELERMLENLRRVDQEDLPDATKPGNAAPKQQQVRKT